MSSKETKKKPIMKAGKVVIILAGRHAGQKAIIVKTFEEGDRKRTFGHALVCGVEKAPQTVTKSMGKKKIEERSKLKPFLKYINFTHVMPTRYTVSEDKIKKFVTAEAMEKANTRKEARVNVKKVLESTYLNGSSGSKGTTAAGTNFLFKKLRF